MQVKSPIWLAVLLGGAVAAPALAGDDAKYPANDFKPSVVYRDQALIEQFKASHNGAAPAVEAHPLDAKYPAAYFHPTTLVHAAAAPKAAEIAHPADPKYPAAYFNPTVIYSAH